MATSEFGMSIDKEDIHYIVRYSVPESPQELGRAEHPVIALAIYYSMDISQTMQWHG